MFYRQTKITNFKEQIVKELKVGIIGFGTVGAGVASCLLKNESVIADRTGVCAKLHKIADLDITTDRGVQVPDGILTTNVEELLESCDIVVELIGGTTIARKFILDALNRGKSVVTANKALIAQFGPELFEAAEKNGADLWFEASVGGGIPIIKSLRESFVGNRIESIYGILNGTCNYIFTRMEREKLGFADVLADAQRLGYAEANPALDIDGFDTAHKASILAALAYGNWYGMDPVYVEGIRNISLTEINYAQELGYRIKLLAILKQNADGKTEIRVHPTLVPQSSPVAGISEVFNGVMVNGDYVGKTLFYGRGAGREATASAVVADIVDVALDLANGCLRRIPGIKAGAKKAETVSMDEIESRYYLRIQVQDKPGVLGSIATLLSASNISIDSLMQRPAGEEAGDVSIIILTHLAVEKNVRTAISQIEALAEVEGAVTLLRIEDI